MKRNIEIKAKIRQSKTSFIEQILKLDLVSSEPVQLEQTDTFYNCSNGRLKLRINNESLTVSSDTKEASYREVTQTSELIWYDRADQKGPKTSRYRRVLLANPVEMHELMDVAYGTIGRIEKSRLVYFVGQTRIHVDELNGKVKGLFVELEVVLRDDQTAEDGQKIAYDLMEKLGIQKDDLIDGAYVDM